MNAPTTVPNARAFLIPAYNAGHRLAEVVAELREACGRAGVTAPIFIVDDGCTDDTFQDPSIDAPGTIVIRHPRNRGKGAALLSGFAHIRDAGIDCVVTLDADGQHPASEAVRLLLDPAPEGALLLGVRDLKAAGAPRANQWSNRFSNLVLSTFGGERLLDTQCGLRRYPLEATLALGARHPKYAFESDVVLRAARRGLPLVQIATAVRYPDEAARVSHFDSVRDPAKIVLRVVLTTLSVPHARVLRRFIERTILAMPFVAWGAWLFL